MTTEAMATSLGLNAFVASQPSSSVPNHLSETKIFTQVDRNSFIQAEPASIHFAGFQRNKTCIRSLKIKNVSNECQRIHVIMPTTAYFTAMYKNKGSLVPGFCVDVAVCFRGDEHKFYEDSIKIHCQGDQNLLVPIYAYPVMNFSKFPRKLTFSATPVGMIKRKCFCLSSPIPVEFEYELSVVKRHPAFTVSPLTGIVPAKGSVKITVAFSPSSFSTATSIIQLSVSQFNMTPIQCTISGHSSPGLTKDVVLERRPDPPPLDPRTITPLGRVRKKRAQVQTFVKKSSTKGIIYAGIRFPEKLEGHAAVARVLNQKAGTLKACELKSVVTLSGRSEELLNPRQAKEASFEQEVRKIADAERTNQLKWMTCLGEDPLSDDARDKILDARVESDRLYKLKQRQPLPSIDRLRDKTSQYQDRTRRSARQVPTHLPTFDLSLNNPWLQRQKALYRFVQAARRVILHERIQKRLNCLRDFVNEWKKGNFSFKSRLELAMEKEQEKAKTQAASLFEVSKVSPFTSPVYKDPNHVDKLAPQSHGLVVIPEWEGSGNSYIPLASKTDPIECMVCGYTEESLFDAVEFTSQTMARPLREESLDELFHLNLNDQAEECGGREESPFPEFTPAIGLTEKNLAPPLHIFSPMPGIQRYLQPLPYSEVDDDYVLCPQNLYPTKTVREEATGHGRATLDKQDVIPSFMHWKLFPSPSLIVTNAKPSFSSVWLPHLADTLNTHLLPIDTPAALTGLAQDDAPDSGEDIQDGFRRLTFEKMKKDFVIPKQPEEVLPPPSEGFGEKATSVLTAFSSHGFIPKEFRKEQMAGFLHTRDNRLWGRIKDKIVLLEASLINVDTKVRSNSGQ